MAQVAEELDEFLTFPEAAEWLRVGRNSIKDMVLDGTVIAVRVRPGRKGLRVDKQRTLENLQKNHTVTTISDDPEAAEAEAS